MKDKNRRSAIVMIDRYGKKALSKAVAAARYYLEINKTEESKRWIQIGYHIQAIETEEETSLLG
jgi:hypothetical protein